MTDHLSSVLCRLFSYDTAMRLLIIEDDRDAADYLVKAFREIGHVADRAADGEEGLALALEGQYDVLVVDRMLPKLDGHEHVVLAFERENRKSTRLNSSHLGISYAVFCLKKKKKKKRIEKH